MKFPPKSEKEIQEMKLFPAGIYDFEVIKAVERESKVGNPMIALKLMVFVDDRVMYVNDYLVVMDSMAFKIRHFCEATGLLSIYEKGELDPQSLIGRFGRCDIQIQKDKDGVYADRNAVRDYIPINEIEKKSVTKLPEQTTLESDEIPF